MMVAPIAWPFDPDWSAGILERLSWLTAIQTSRTGAEQRQALRIVPRRQIDLPLILTGRERAYFDVLMMRNGGAAWYAPIPHEEIAVGTVDAAQDTFTFDTSYREIAVGMKLLLRGVDALHTEMVEVNSVASDHIVTSAVNNYYPVATLTPTFKAVIAEKLDMQRRTAQVFTGTARFVSVEPMVWPTTARTLATLATFTPLGGPSYPILTTPPNSVNDLDFSYERLFSTVDNSQSNPVYIDKAQRAFASQKYEWFLVGRQERQDFRDLLFALQGRCKPVWVPTFNDDLSYNQGYADPLGFGDAGPPPGREHYVQYLTDGTVHVYPVPPAAMTAGDRIPNEVYASGSVRRSSFVSLKRLDVDEIEFTHHVNSDGVATVSALLRDAPDLRVPMSFTAQGFPYSGYWTAPLDIGTRIPAVNISTGLTESLTITGPAGGAA